MYHNKIQFHVSSLASILILFLVNLLVFQPIHNELPPALSRWRGQVEKLLDKKVASNTKSLIVNPEYSIIFCAGYQVRGRSLELAGRNWINAAVDVNASRHGWFDRPTEPLLIRIWVRTVDWRFHGSVLASRDLQDVKCNQLLFFIFSQSPAASSFYLVFARDFRRPGDASAPFHPQYISVATLLPPWILLLGSSRPSK